LLCCLNLSVVGVVVGGHETFKNSNEKLVKINFPRFFGVGAAFGSCVAVYGAIGPIRKSTKQREMLPMGNGKLK